MSDEYDKPHPFGGAVGRNVNERRTSAMWQHGRSEFIRGRTEGERAATERIAKHVEAHIYNHDGPGSQGNTFLRYLAHSIREGELEDTDA